jgi:hypothetical protein
MLAALAISGALFMSAGCQNDTAAQPAGAQITTEVTSSSATPMPSPATATVATTAPPALHLPPAPTVSAVAPEEPAQASVSCAGDYYRNSDGNCVRRPEQAATPPSGATAQCKDASYSFSRHRQGTCSGHGGVAQWL